MPKGSWREFSDFQGEVNPIKGVSTPKANKKVRLYRTRGGKAGKLVTVIEGLELDNKSSKVLLKSLKALCGTGGTVKDASLELQGDQIIKVMDFLIGEGYQPKQSGG